MRSGRMARRLVATAGMGAILAMGVLTACASKEAPAPETVTKTVTETAAPPAMLVNNAGRSIRRGVLNSLDRLHDYERTMQLQPRPSNV